MNDGVAHALFSRVGHNSVCVDQHDQLKDAKHEKKNKENGQGKFDLRLSIFAFVQQPGARFNSS